MIPESLAGSSLWLDLEKIMPVAMSETDYRDFHTRLPLTVHSHDCYFYIMNLPEYGFLMLAKKTEDIPAVILKHLPLL